MERDRDEIWKILNANGFNMFQSCVFHGFSSLFIKSFRKLLRHAWSGFSQSCGWSLASRDACWTKGCKQNRSREIRRDSRGRYGSLRSSRMACSNLTCFAALGEVIASETISELVGGFSQPICQTQSSGNMIMININIMTMIIIIIIMIMINIMINIIINIITIIMIIIMINIMIIMIIMILILIIIIIPGPKNTENKRNRNHQPVCQKARCISMEFCTTQVLDEHALATASQLVS